MIVAGPTSRSVARMQLAQGWALIRHPYCARRDESDLGAGAASATLRRGSHSTTGRLSVTEGAAEASFSNRKLFAVVLIVTCIMLE